MFARIDSLFALTVILVSSGSAALAQYEDEHKHAHAAVGNPAPAFTLTSSDGEKVSLSDFEGKVVVLEWTNHECPVVNRYVAKQKTMQKTIESFKDKDVVWLSIDSSHFADDKKDSINKWRKKMGTDHPMLLDAAGKVGHQYGARTTPHMFVISADGVLAYAGSMDDDRYGDKDNPRNYVSEAVTALLAGSTVSPQKTKPFGCSVKYKR